MTFGKKDASLRHPLLLNGLMKCGECIPTARPIEFHMGWEFSGYAALKRYLEIIEEEHMVENSRMQGEFLLAEVEKLRTEFPHCI